MRINLSHLEKKLSEISLFKEDPESIHNTLVQKSDRNRGYTERTPRNLKSNSGNCGFKSEIGKVYKPHGEVRQVTPLYHKIVKNFFNVSLQHDTIYLKDDDKNSLQLKKIQEQTQQAKNKLKNLSVNRDPLISEIRSKIVDTSRKLKYSKAGNSIENSINPHESTAGILPEDSSYDKQKQIRKKLIEKVRNMSFEKKLNFYVENPTLAQRRIKTSHLPWEDPSLPKLPSTPENSKYYSNNAIQRENTVKMPKKVDHRISIHLEFLRNPKLLGPKGGKLLLQIINDEKNSVRTSEAEIRQLNNIINRRIKIIRDRENGWEQEVFNYAMDKVLLKPTCKVTKLINSYFQ